MKLFLTFAIIVFLSATGIRAQIFVNEACSDNWSVAEDEDGDESDWFELFNAGSTARSLNGYSVSDNSGTIWYFPDIYLNPGSFLLIFASGKNRTGSELHTNFKLSKEGDVLIFSDASQTETDTLIITPLKGNLSCGNRNDGDDSFVGVFSNPTPGSANSASFCYSSFTEDPSFSIKSGFYPTTLNLSLITAHEEETIRYTTDGSTPQISSAEYSIPLIIENTTCLKIRAFNNDTTVLPSDVLTNTYFIGYTSELPVFSISTQPEHLWDPDSGIYVSGNHADTAYPYYGANFWQDWEIPAHIEFFEENHSLALEQDIGLSINGGSVSRTKPQKSFRLTARNIYGTPVMEHRFFDNKNIAAYKTLVLRNASGDWNKSHFRDGCIHDLLTGKTDIDIMSYRPAAIFLNGQYWGVLNIRERVSKYYIGENYGIDEENADILEEDSSIIEGSFAEFTPVLQFITENNMSDAALYDSAATMIDIPSLCDYFIAETFFSNIDWPYNNIKYWKERGPGHRWRYFLIDLDISLGNFGWAPDSMDVLGRILGPYGDDNNHVRIFKSLLQNGVFRQYFINRYADLVNTLLSAESLSDHIEKASRIIKSEMPMQFQRWGGNMTTWYLETGNVIIPYVLARPQFALGHVQKNFGLAAQVPVHLDVWPPQGGTILINTIEPETYPWVGTYFNGNPITLTAVANDGFVFCGWKSSCPGFENEGNVSFVTDPVAEYHYTAFFSPRENASGIFVYPNPADYVIHAGCFNTGSGTGTAEIINAGGNTVLSESMQFITGPNNFDIFVQGLGNGVYTLRVNTSGETFITKILILHRL